MRFGSAVMERLMIIFDIITKYLETNQGRDNYDLVNERLRFFLLNGKIIFTTYQQLNY